MLQVWDRETDALHEYDPSEYEKIFDHPDGSEVYVQCGVSDIHGEYVLGHKTGAPPRESPFRKLDIDGWIVWSTFVTDENIVEHGWKLA